MKWLPVKAGLFLFIATCGTALLQVDKAVAAGVEYSMKMPNVASSVLLDITRAGQRLVAVGERGHILYSEDEGNEWVQAQVPTTAMLTRVFFFDDRSGWAVGHDGNVLHSRDGGVSWEMQRDGVADQVLINEQRAGRALRHVEALRSQLELSGDEALAALEEALSEAEWSLENAVETMEQSIYAPPLMDVWFANSEQGWAAGAYGVLLYTANGGRDWADWSYKVDNPEELHLNGVIGDKSGTLYLASEWGTVFVSSNGGEAWESVQSGYDGSFFGLVFNPGSGYVYVHGLLGTIYRSADRGLTWQAMQSGVSASLFGAEASEGTLVFVGQGGTATLSHDDGANFVPLNHSGRGGLFGVTSLGSGVFIATGEGGSRILTESSGGQSRE